MHADRMASGATAGSANRLLIMMRYIFNLALRWELPGIKANPCAGVPLLEVNNQRERYLSQDEAKRLYDAVCESENPMLKFIVPMLILTGTRKRKVLDSKWTDFDLERRIWRIPTTKADLADVRMHDLRHSFASLLINSGRTLYEAQNILGHTQFKTTQRYAHLSQDTFLAAANTATVAINLPIGLPQLESQPHV
jgi:integrase